MLHRKIFIDHTAVVQSIGFSAGIASQRDAAIFVNTLHDQPALRQT